MVEKDSSADAKGSPTQRSGKALGPDGKPCRVCTEFRSWNPSKTTARGASNGEPGRTIRKAGTAATPLASPTQHLECPPDSAELGRATWTFLHTTAAYFPERPTAHQRANMLGLLRSLPLLYACTPCAEHLAVMMEENPPDVSGRKALSRWLCERHNEVNDLLGKERFDCERTDERWKDGPSDGSCD